MENCPSCKHPRKVHSKNGCTEWIDPVKGKECPCKKTYMDLK